MTPHPTQIPEGELNEAARLNLARNLALWALRQSGAELDGTSSQAHILMQGKKALTGKVHSTVKQAEQELLTWLESKVKTLTPEFTNVPATRLIEILKDKKANAKFITALTAQLQTSSTDSHARPAITIKTL